MLKQILFVALGGATGSVFRYLVSALTEKCTSFTFPLATFTVNIIGCFLIGLFMNLLPASSLRFLLIVGFCGGFTTFSTFSNEALALINNNQPFLALTYVALSCCLGIGAVWLGLFLTK